MVYIFVGEDNLASVVYDGKYLSEETKEKAIKLETLPVDESKKGQVAILKANKATREVWYEYEDIPLTEEGAMLQRIDKVEQQLQVTQEAMDFIIMNSLGGEM